MITATSCSKNKFKNIYLGTIRRHMGMSVFYLVLMLALFPLLYLLQILSLPDQEAFQVERINPEWYFYGHGGVYTGVTGFTITMLCIIVPILFGTMIFSYLHNKRATDVFHSLPVRREKLFSANYLAGLTIINLPIVLAFLLVISIGAANKWVYQGMFYPGKMVQEMVCWMVIASVIYTITCFTSIVSGTSFDSAILSLALCVVVPVILLTVRMTMEGMLLGFAGFQENSLMDWGNIALFTPFAPMIFHMSAGIDSDPSASYTSSLSRPDYTEKMLARSNIAILCWLLTAVVLLLVTIHLYKKRKSEMAGRANSRTPLTKTIQYAVTFVCAVIFGMILWAVFDESLAMNLLGVVVGGGIAFTAYEAVLSRGFRTFPKAFLHMGISVGVAGVFILIMGTGGLGFEGRIPDTGDIQSVKINYYGRYTMAYENELPYNERGVVLTEPESIEMVRNFHQEAYRELSQPDLGDWQRSAFDSPTITYLLKNGKVLVRSYYAVGEETFSLLGGLEEKQEFKRQTNPAYILQAGQVPYIILHDPLNSGESSGQIWLTKENQEQLLEALRKDADKETLKDLQAGAKAVGYLTLGVPREKSPYQWRGVPDILLTEEYTATMEFLGELPQVERLFSSWEQEFSPETVQIERAAVYQPSYSGWGRQKAGYIYIGAGEYIENDEYIFAPEMAGYEWHTDIAPEDMADLYANAYHQVANPSGIGLTVYFDLVDKENACLLYVPYEKAPELVEKYMPAGYREEVGILPLSDVNAAQEWVDLPIVE